MTSLEDAAITLYHLKHCPLTGPIKLCLAHLNIDYEDEPIPWREWALKREEIITARVPALRIQYRNGRLEWMTEAPAIMRSLGKFYNLLGRTDMDNYYCERIIGKVRESENLLARYFKCRKFHDADKEDYEKFKEKLFKDVSVVLTALDKMLNETTGNYAAGDQITIADFYLLDFIDFIRNNKPEFLKNFPSLAKWRKHLMETDQRVARFTAARSWVII